MSDLRLPLDYKEDVHFSVRNMSTEPRMSFKMGLNYPIYFKKLYPGDKFQLDLSTLLQSEPLPAPIMGDFVLRTTVVFEPDSNLYGWLDNNARLTTEELLSRRRHYYPIDQLPHWNPDANPKQSNFVLRGSLMDFLGVKPASYFTESSIVAAVRPSTTLAADRILTYLDTMRNYFFNTQTSKLPYFVWRANGANDIKYLRRDDLDNFFIWLRQQNDGVAISNSNPDVSRFASVATFINEQRSGALVCAQYEPDMLRNILYNVSTSKINVTVENNQFSIDTLRFRNKLQRLVDRYDLSGGRFSSWLKTVWGSRSSKRMDIPQFIGTTSTIISSNTITSVSNTVQGVGDNATGSEIGQLAGNINQGDWKGKNKNKNFSHYISVDEPGTLMVVMSLVPNVDYAESIDRELTETRFACDYKPQWAQLGFQDVPASDYTAVPFIVDGAFSPNTGSNVASRTHTEIVGKQIAWMHLMSDYNRLYGEFTTGGTRNYWVLSRHSSIEFDNTNPDYGHNNMIKESRPLRPSYYVDPREWTYIFSDSDPTVDNLYLQYGLKIRAVRPIGKRFMPTME